MPCVRMVRTLCHFMHIKNIPFKKYDIEGEVLKCWFLAWRNLQTKLIRRMEIFGFISKKKKYLKKYLS